MEIILGKRIEEVERERISRRDGLRRAVYLGAIYRGCETGRALTLQHLPFLSLSLFWEMDVELKLKKGNGFGSQQS